MIFIEGGTFVMGSPSDEYDRDFDEMLRDVYVSSFYISEFVVTQEEYRRIIRKNPSHFKGKKLPVDSVSWFNALDFCNRLSIRNGLTPVYIFDGMDVTWDANANGYRLPTEAEWEYACRAGTNTPFNTGDNISTNLANYNGFYPYNFGPIGENLDKTAPVGSYPPNQWGLYEMHGNIFEWCWDWFDYYKRDDVLDPKGPSTGTYRVIRGGSWANNGHAIRSAYRNFYIPGFGNERIGFRLVRNTQ